MILGIDPNTEVTAWVLYDPITHTIAGKGERDNDVMLLGFESHQGPVVCEWIDRPMTAGRETYETCRWVGRFEQKCSELGVEFHVLARRQVSLELCAMQSARDCLIRAELIALFGGTKERAIGKRKTPGPLHGVTGHAWAALAVAVAWERIREAHGRALRAGLGAAGTAGT